MNTNKIIDKIEKDELINIIKDHAVIEYNSVPDIYLVGGAFRDFYLDKENSDKDIIVDKVEAREFAKTLAGSLGATFIPLDEENKIYRLILKDKINCIDIANPIGNSIEEDLKRRDLTINSVAVNIKTLEILDFTGGIDDLKSKKIKLISEQNLIDDPLRMLRAYRFQSLLGFELDEQLTKAVSEHAKKIHTSAVERINYELLKMFSDKFCDKALVEMDKSGLLEEILPIVVDLKKVPPNSHHHLNLFDHSVEVVRQIQILYENSSSDVKAHLESTDFGGNTRLAHLKLAGFLHDIGKFSTWTIEELTGRHRFIKHDDVGSKMSIKILKSAKYSKKQTDYIAKMIKFHIYPSHVVCAPDLNEKIYMRFVRKMGNDVLDVITLAIADRLSARGEAITQEIVNKNIGALNTLLSFYLNVKDGLEPLPKLIGGLEIMAILDIKPSKRLGEIITTLKEAQVSGDVTTKEQAITFIKAQ